LEGFRNLSPFITWESALAITTDIASGVVILTSVETFHSRLAYMPSGLMSWDIARLRNRGLSTGRVAPFFNCCLTYKSFITVMLLSGFMAVISLSENHNYYLKLLPSLFILASLFLASIRSPFGRDGADQMLLQIFVCIVICHGFPTDKVRQMCLVFIALQSILAYTTAGVAKFISPDWRSGKAIRGIFDSEVYGFSFSALIPESTTNWLSRLIAWGVISFECCFWLCLCFKKLTLPMLILGVAFHGMAAYLMGLNSFFFVFLATYPSIWMCSERYAIR
jgi:hypothetical protein